MFKIKVRGVARSYLDHLLDEGEVLRVDTLEHHVQIGFQSAIVSNDRKGFGRPNQLAGGDVPAETAGATQALGFRQIGLASTQGFFTSRALDGNAGKMGEAFDEFLILWCWAAGLAGEDCESPQDLSFRRKYWGRPAGLQTVGECQATAALPQRVRADISRDDLLLAESGCPARSPAGSDFASIKLPSVGRWEAGSRPLTKALAFRVQ